MRIDPQPPARARAIALPLAQNGAHSSRNRNKTLHDRTWLALLLLPLPVLAAGFGKARDMSWLGGNWYGVVAFFGIPALLGILCWSGAHYVIGARHRHERARETRHRPF